MDPWDRLGCLGLIAGLLFMAYLVIAAGIAVYSATECTKLGYPSVNVTWDLESYCIREIDETEYVVHLDSVRAGVTVP